MDNHDMGTIEDLVKYRLEKAFGALKDADLLINEDSFGIYR